MIETINDIEISRGELIELELVGIRNFEIDIYDLYKFIFKEQIIKIKNNTKINFNYEKIKNEKTLRGFFIKEMLNKLENVSDDSERECMIRAMEIGLEQFEK